MKIALIGPGIMTIPPQGWGGVEALMHNYKLELLKRGHEVLIVNTSDMNLLKFVTNSWQPDFVHLHYDAYVDVLKEISCNRTAVTSHFPYIDVPHLVGDYKWIFEKFSTSSAEVFCLSDRNQKSFIENEIEPSRIWKWIYGVSIENFKFSSSPKHKNRTLCLGKIEPRKSQFELQALDDSIDFVGPIADFRFDVNKNYIGAWTREQVYSNLTEYANLILLSDGESFAQVIPEALSCGLGVVVSEEASANLNVDLPFIDVVNRKFTDFANLNEIIKKNREQSLKRRKEIRNYAKENFDLENCVNRYVEKIERLLQGEK